MAVNMRYPSNYAGNDATQNYIRQQQEYIQQLQEQVKNYQKAQEIYSNPIGQYSYRGSSYRNMKRNSMGRYSRTNGLHDMIDNLPEDKMMQVQRYIEEMGRM